MRSVLIAALAALLLASTALSGTAWAQPYHPDHTEQASGNHPATDHPAGDHSGGTADHNGDHPVTDTPVYHPTPTDQPPGATYTAPASNAPGGGGSFGGGGRDNRVAVCHNEDDVAGANQRIEVRMVQPGDVKKYLNSPSGLDYVMPAGGCGATQ